MLERPRARHPVRAAVAAKRPRGVARPVHRGRRGAGPDRPVALRPRRQGPPGRRGHRRLLRQRDRPSEPIEFEISESYLCGDEVADVGIIRTTLAGGTHVAVVRGVYTYRSDGAGKLAALRAFWEFDAELVELGAEWPCVSWSARPLHRRRSAGPPGRPVHQLRQRPLLAGRRLHLLRHRGPRAGRLGPPNGGCGPGRR